MKKIQEFLETFFGPNWRTSFYGLVTVASGTIAVSPELVSFLPDSMEGYIVGLSKIIAIITGSAVFLNTKDKHVTGGIVPSTNEAKDRVNEGNNK